MTISVALSPGVLAQLGGVADPTNPTDAATKNYVDTQAGGVTKIIAGSNVTISPSTGVGQVTINASGGGSGGIAGIYQNDQIQPIADSTLVTQLSNTPISNGLIFSSYNGSGRGSITLVFKNTSGTLGFTVNSIYLLKANDFTWAYEGQFQGVAPTSGGFFYTFGQGTFSNTTTLANLTAGTLASAYDVNFVVASNYVYTQPTANPDVDGLTPVVTTEGSGKMNQLIVTNYTGHDNLTITPYQSGVVLDVPTSKIAAIADTEIAKQVLTSNVVIGTNTATVSIIDTFNGASGNTQTSFAIPLSTNASGGTTSVQNFLPIDKTRLRAYQGLFVPSLGTTFSYEWNIQLSSFGATVTGDNTAVAVNGNGLSYGTASAGKYLGDQSATVNLDAIRMTYKIGGVSWNSVNDASGLSIQLLKEGADAEDPSAQYPAFILPTVQVDNFYINGNNGGGGTTAQYSVNLAYINYCNLSSGPTISSATAPASFNDTTFGNVFYTILTLSSVTGFNVGGKMDLRNSGNAGWNSSWYVKQVGSGTFNSITITANQVVMYFVSEDPNGGNASVIGGDIPGKLLASPGNYAAPSSGATLVIPWTNLAVTNPGNNITRIANPGLTSISAFAWVQRLYPRFSASASASQRGNAPFTTPTNATVWRYTLNIVDDIFVNSHPSTTVGTDCFIDFQSTNYYNEQILAPSGTGGLQDYQATLAQGNRATNSAIHVDSLTSPTKTTTMSADGVTYNGNQALIKSFTTTGSGAASYSTTTGALNIPTAAAAFIGLTDFSTDFWHIVVEQVTNKPQAFIKSASIGGSGRIVTLNMSGAVSSTLVGKLITFTPGTLPVPYPTTGTDVVLTVSTVTGATIEATTPVGVSANTAWTTVFDPVSGSSAEAIGQLLYYKDTFSDQASLDGGTYVPYYNTITQKYHMASSAELRNRGAASGNSNERTSGVELNYGEFSGINLRSGNANTAIGATGTLITEPTSATTERVLVLPAAQAVANQVLSVSSVSTVGSQQITNLTWAQASGGSSTPDAIGFEIGGGISDTTPPTTISFTDATRVFTLGLASGVTSYNVWIAGQKFVITTSQTVTIPNTSGLYYITYQIVGGNAQLVQSLTPYDLQAQAPVSLVYWNATDGTQYFLADERHWLTMDWKTHLYLHQTQGARYASGFAISGSTTGTGTLAVDAQIGITSGVFYDEDIQFSLTGNVVGTFQTAIMYRVGSIWKKDALSVYPYKFGTATAAYNLNTGGNWSVADLGNGNYGVMYVCATNDVNTPFIVLMGQQTYSNQTQAVAAQFSDMDVSGLPLNEFKVLYKLEFQTQTAMTNVVKVQQKLFTDYRTSITSVTAPFNAIDTVFREAPTQVFSADATASTAWTSYVQGVPAWISYVANYKLSATNTVASGKVYTLTQGSKTVYRFVSTTKGSDGYPTTDGIYANFDGTAVSNLIVLRGS